IGTVKGLQQIHAYLFGGLYDFAGRIRDKNISKGNFKFASALFLEDSLHKVEMMPENTFEEIVNKYIEMNICHPFMEGNGRSTRIWLDLMLKRNINRCIDWSSINKQDYLSAMKISTISDKEIKELLYSALTDKTNDREVFMKGIDYSYYYEQEDFID
ncbi:MAG: cell filamentation protein Fic, partial [Christensenellaceae bacterium]|nr:cell filamentation protein Fic [Christensenellaceae bacterium]